MQNHLEISSKNKFWTQNMQNSIKSRKSDMSGGRRTVGGRSADGRRAVGGRSAGGRGGGARKGMHKLNPKAIVLAKEPYA